MKTNPEDSEKFYDELAKDLTPGTPIERADSNDPFVAETELKTAMERDFTIIHNLKTTEFSKPPEKPLSFVLPLLFILAVLLWAWMTGRVPGSAHRITITGKQACLPQGLPNDIALPRFVVEQGKQGPIHWDHRIGQSWEYSLRRNRSRSCNQPRQPIG